MSSATCHIHAPQPDAVWLERVQCPTCERRRYFVSWYTPWYGPDTICLFCGEHFTDEGRCERPFQPGWREANRERARHVWRTFHCRPKSGGPSVAEPAPPTTDH